MTLYILSGYNNYYNRIVKKFDTLEEYLQFQEYEESNANFVPNDGVNTEHVIGTYSYSGKGDYLIAYDPSTQEINSRWFIIDSVRTKSGQYKLTLRRDLIVDYYNSITQAPMFIEKATVSDTDPAIYNSESVSVNQIKTTEYALKDDSKSAWIVGYFNRDMEQKDIQITYSNPTVDIVMNEGQTFNQFLTDNRAHRLQYINLSFYFYNHDLVENNFIKYKATLNRYYDEAPEWTVELVDVVGNTSGFIWSSSSSMQVLLQNQINALNSLKKSDLLNVSKMYINTGTIFQPSKCKEIFKYSGRIIQEYQGTKKYKVYAAGKSKDYSLNNISDISSIDDIQAVKTYLTTKLNSAIPFYARTPEIDLKWSEEQVFLTGSDVSFETFTLNFPGKADRVHLNDAPYDMFCIPYKDGGLNIKITDEEDKYGGQFKSMDSISALTAAQSIAEELGTNLYDLQLLPFCPLQGWSLLEGANEQFEKVVGRVSEDGHGGLVSSEVRFNSSVGFVIFFSTSSQGTINSEQLHLINTEDNEEQALPLSLLNKKISNECDMYRLCSPNYNGLFQFTASKLNGITGFNVDYTYLPYSPYIHINPNFSGLYGKDFDDARGLICQGDFSISYLSDKWKEYQVQNKNYANIFARQKANLETTQEVQRSQQIFNSIVGTVMGGASGAVTGSNLGGGGALAGGIIGTLASAAGGAQDIYYADKLRHEALSYQQDMYNYQLDNIKAMPDSIAKVTAYTRNNKIFPILEYYTCTDVEKRAIANKIAYNGMTVGRIGTMMEFVNNQWSYENIESQGYIKGQLIRLDDKTIGEDFHIVNSISGELNKGVFIK